MKSLCVAILASCMATLTGCSAIEYSVAVTDFAEATTVTEGALSTLNRVVTEEYRAWQEQPLIEKQDRRLEPYQGDYTLGSGRSHLVEG